MPSVLLPVPHFEQSHDGMCLPACAKMVLAYWGKEYSERQLAQLLGTQPFGTPLSHISRLQRWNYQAVLGSLTVDQLRAHLLNQQPVIVRVWTAMLDYWNIDTSHVVVIVGFDETQVYLNDPSYSKSPQLTSWTAFLAAWAEFDETAIVISPS